jgi:hypothetical protein
MKKAICLLVLTLTAAPYWAATPEGQVTVAGMVRAAEMTNRGEPLRVYIETIEEPILLSRQDKGKELLRLVDAKVQVTGYLRKVRNNENFTKVIYITEYTVEDVSVQQPPGTVDKPSD